VSGVLKMSGRDHVNWGVAGGKAIASYMNDGWHRPRAGCARPRPGRCSLGYVLYYGTPGTPS
jgi:hypothetical protein